MATVAAIALLAAVSAPMALELRVVASILVLRCSKSGGRGAAVHLFADKAAVIDGEMVVINNMPLGQCVLRCGPRASPVRRVVDQEMTARRRGLLYLEAAHPAP
jgi:hypothetical protein